MKIEKINDNQIRCILTKEDLASRHMRLSELAYGSQKARDLFHDMMQEASYQVGFDSEDLPLMIEAIPMTAESVVLVISKVEYPEELDTRFSRFSEGPLDQDYEDYKPYDNTVTSEGADNILDMFRKMKDELNKKREAQRQSSGSDSFVPLSDTAPVLEDVDPERIKAAPAEEEPPYLNVRKLFVFRQMEDLCKVSEILRPVYDEQNTLYKNPENQKYYLVTASGRQSPEQYNKVCNILTEYGIQEKYTQAEEAHFSEHFDIIIPGRAIQVLGTI